jgi:hypothetical protein
MRKYRANWRLWGRLFGIFYIPPFVCFAWGAATDYIETGRLGNDDIRFIVVLGLWGTAFAAATSWLLHAAIVLRGEDRRPRISERQVADSGDTLPAG